MPELRDRQERARAVTERFRRRRWIPIAGEPAVQPHHELRRAAAGSHLVLGVSYARTGLRDAAEEEFRALRDANPDSPIAKSLLASVQR